MRRFVLVNGLAVYGTAMFVAMGIVMPWMKQGPAALTPLHLAIHAVAWSLGGLAFGALTWGVSEKVWRKYRTEQEGMDK
jgi:hypothetical protein